MGDPWYRNAGFALRAGAGHVHQQAVNAGEWPYGEEVAVNTPLHSILSVIGARYLATKKELDLGPWSRGVSAEEVKQGTRASPVLREVLTSYTRGEYF